MSLRKMSCRLLFNGRSPRLIFWREFGVCCLWRLRWLYKALCSFIVIFFFLFTTFVFAYVYCIIHRFSCNFHEKKKEVNFSSCLSSQCSFPNSQYLLFFSFPLALFDSSRTDLSNVWCLCDCFFFFFFFFTMAWYQGDLGCSTERADGWPISRPGKALTADTVTGSG